MTTMAIMLLTINITAPLPDLQ